MVGGRKILAQGTFRLLYMNCRNFGRSSYQVEKEKKKNCLPLAAESPAAAMVVLFVPSTRASERRQPHGARIFFSQLEVSYISRKILTLGPSSTEFLHVY